MKRTVRAALVAAVAAALVAPTIAMAQTVPSPYDAQLRTQLANFRSAAAQANMVSVEGPYYGALRQGERFSHTIGLAQGLNYSIVAVCDDDCGDIDLRLYDAAGNLVDDDVLVDDYPVVEVTPSRNGQYRVEVDMYNCASEPCFYALELFAN